MGIFYVHISLEAQVFAYKDYLDAARRGALSCADPGSADALR